MSILIRGHGVFANKARTSPADLVPATGFDLMTATGARRGTLTPIESGDAATGGMESAASISGGDGDDIFYLGATMDDSDSVDGGRGTDRLYLQGDYTGDRALTLNGLVNVEQLILLSADDTSFGGGAPGPFSYDITTADRNVSPSGVDPFAVFVIDARSLGPGENLVVDGSAENDGSLLIRAGQGVDSLTGGSVIHRSDFFEFGDNFTMEDRVDGGSGLDPDLLILRGNYSGSRALLLGTGPTLQGIEALLLVSGHAMSLNYYAYNVMSFDSDVGDLHYEVTTMDDLVAPGGRFGVSARTLATTESLMFDGSAESDGSLSVLGGGGADWIRGGSGEDYLSGGGDADILYGGPGNDRFGYFSAADSLPGNRDTIMDFARGDKIELYGIDADLTTEDHDAFSFIGHAPFRGHAGELRVEGRAGVWVVSADRDGDRVADFEILIFAEDHRPPLASDFLL